MLHRLGLLHRLRHYYSLRFLATEETLAYDVELAAAGSRCIRLPDTDLLEQSAHRVLIGAHALALEQLDHERSAGGQDLGRQLERQLGELERPRLIHGADTADVGRHVRHNKSR